MRLSASAFCFLTFSSEWVKSLNDRKYLWFMTWKWLVANSPPSHAWWLESLLNYAKGQRCPAYCLDVHLFYYLLLLLSNISTVDVRSGFSVLICTTLWYSECLLQFRWILRWLLQSRCGENSILHNAFDQQPEEASKTVWACFSFRKRKNRAKHKEAVSGIHKQSTTVSSRCHAECACPT